jgi:hypothetical protein
VQGAARDLQTALDALAAGDGRPDWARLDTLVDRWRDDVVSGGTDRGGRRAWASTVLTLLQQTGPAHDLSADRPASRLDDLRAVLDADPTDAALREMLAAGLVSALVRTWETGESTIRDLLLSELRHLNESGPPDPGVRDQYAKALVVTVLEARKAGETWLVASHLQALRALIPSVSPRVAETASMALPELARGTGRGAAWTARLPWLGRRLRRG